jgi:hypothetical protein
MFRSDIRTIKQLLYAEPVSRAMALRWFTMSLPQDRAGAYAFVYFDERSSHSNWNLRQCPHDEELTQALGGLIDCGTMQRDRSDFEGSCVEYRAAPPF